MSHFGHLADFPATALGTFNNRPQFWQPNSIISLSEFGI
jgi:hypothetical protein